MTGTKFDDVKISAKGISKACVGETSLYKVADGTWSVDYVESLDNMYANSNLEISDYKPSSFFGRYVQADFIDETKDAYAIYTVPEGNTISDFAVFTRHDGSHQGVLKFEISSDGINWKQYSTNDYIISAWFYANGGHRLYSHPTSKMVQSIENAKYLKLTLSIL